MKLLRNKAGMYLREVVGVSFVTWVSEIHRNHALAVRQSEAIHWQQIFQLVTGESLDVVDMYHPSKARNAQL